MSQGSNSSALRHFNERVVICTLRKQGAASKPELAKLVGLTLQTLTRIVDDLEHRQLIRATGRRTQGVGQPSNIYQINPESLYSIGVQIDRDGLQCMLLNFAGECLAKSSNSFENIAPGALVELIASEAQTLFAILDADKVRKFAGVGVALPSFAGSWAEMDQNLSKRWLDFDLAAQLQTRLPGPIFYENSCTAAAAAELYFGKSNSTKNFLYVYIGSSVGGGLVLDGDLERGIFSNAACLATMPVPASALASSNIQGETTLVDRASINSLINHLNFHNVAIQHSSQLTEIIDSNRAFIHEWMLDCADSLVYIIHSTIGLLDLEKIIVDSDLPDYLLAELINIIRRKLEKTERANLFIPKLQQGSLGINAKIMGGAILPLYAHFAPDKTVILKGGVPDRQ